MSYGDGEGFPNSDSAAAGTQKTIRSLRDFGVTRPFEGLPVE
jgi:hypothetical protein